MKYSFSIKLTSDSPDNFGVDIAGLGHTAFTERYKVYNFDVEQGHSIRFNRMNTDANVIVENTGTVPFIWEDNVPRTRLNLKPRQRKQVSIAAGTTSLYPYPEEHMGRTNYFETKEVEMFERSVICLFYAGERSEPTPNDAELWLIQKMVVAAVRNDFTPEIGPGYLFKSPPFDKAEFFDRYYAPAKYLIRLQGHMGSNVERDKLDGDDLHYAKRSRMTEEQISGLAVPVPAQDFLQKGIEPPGHYLGFEYLVVTPWDGSKRDVEFYVAAPSK